MSPSRFTRSSSRRSSILKPPKPRQPLQSLNFNNSSNDNSPATTTKIKRRVSFAEKKHIKEFCNSVEQGTVWDSTYEEHDVSSLKSSCTSSEGSSDVQSIFKENIQITEFHNEIVYINSENVDTYSTQVSNKQFISNEIIQKDLNVENCDMNFTNTVDNTECPHTLSTQEEVLLSASSIVFHSTLTQKNESIFATNLQLNSNNHMHKNITVYKEPDGTTSNKVSDFQQSNINNVNCNDMNVTSVQNTHTTLSETVCNTLHINTNHIQDNKLEDTLKSTSMELTKAVPISMNICRSISQSTNNVFQEQNTKKDNTKVEKAVDYIFDPIDHFNHGELVAKDFDNVSMEITAAVSNLQRVDCDPNSVSYNNDKGITIFHDTSVEITKPVQTSTDINMMCRNETSEVPQYKYDITCTGEKTMEITKAVPTNIHSGTTHNFEKLGYNINSDKSSANTDSTLCIDEEMEFTTALTSLLQVPPNNLNNNDSVRNTPYMHWNSHNSVLKNSGNDNTNSLSDRTRIFHNKSVTATAIVLPVSMTDVCEKEMVNGETNLNKQESSRTVLFSNMSMEITETGSLLQSDLPTKNSVLDCPEEEQLVSSKIYEDKNLPNKVVDCETNLNKHESSKTVLFPNMSMEITEAVSLLQNNLRTENSVMDCPKGEQLVSSKIYEDKNLPNKMVDCETNLNKQESSKTVLFPSMSMEITAAVSLLQSDLPPKNSVVDCPEEEQLVSSKIYEDTNLPNKMVDCETNLNKQESSKTVLFPNMSMEITEAVSLLQNNLRTENSVVDCPKEEQLVSSKIYETLPNKMVDCVTNLNKHESSKTVLFPSMSMEITEAVSLLQNNLRTENSVVDCPEEEQLVSSKIYETLPNKMVDCVTNLNKHESSKTVLFPNMSMEITEAVSLLQSDLQTENSVVDCPEEEQLVSSKIYETLPNKMVDCVTNLNKHESSKTVLFPNMSMEITEAVSLLQSDLQTENSVVDCPEEEQLVSSKIYENKTLPNKMVHCETNLNKQESSRTVLFPNMSMEITEAVSLLRNNHPIGNSVANSNEVEQLVSSEKYENKNLSNNSLNQTTIPDNVLKDITPLVIPSSLNSEVCLEKENCVTANSQNLKECFSNEPALNGFIKSVNSRISLHGSIEENICASALEENNTETACAPLHAASYEPFCAASSKINQSKCLQIQHSQDIISHPRRTYVIKPCIDHSLINNSKENIKISEVNNVIQNKEISLTFLNESLEELESIKPPSFIGLDDSLDESVNVDTRTYDLSKSLNRSKVIESVQNNQVDVFVKNVDKSKICLNECTPLDDEPVSSNVEHKDQVQTSEIRKLQLSFMNITNTELLVPDCSLPSTTITKRTLIFDEEKSEDTNSQDACTDNFNVEDQNMECSSLNINDIHEETSKIDVENNYLCNDTSKLCNDQNIELNSFSSLIKELRVCARSNDIIWDVYHENIERKMFIIGFISCSLLVVIFLEDDCNTTNVQLIKDIKIISRLADDADVFINIVHRIIIEKLCTAKLVDIYRNNENILPMLEYISKEVKLAMDFMFDLKHLYNLNLMEITRDSISFISRTKKMEIILKVTVNVKSFEKIEFQDISVHCLLGSVREEDIKKLITNIKRDHRFFRRYMSDVRDYIYVMEDSCILNTIPR